MYPKALFVALLSLSLSVGAIPAAKKGTNANTTSNAATAAQTCDTAVATTTVTVTSTVGATATSLAAVPNANVPPRGNNGAVRGNTGKGNTGKGNTGKGNTGTQTTTTAAAASSSAVAVTPPPKGGNNAGTGGVAANPGCNDPQTSLCIDPKNVMTLVDGSAEVTAGQELSAVSTNNYANYCLTQNLPLANGQQILDGSCSQVPMGQIVAQSKMPAAKFVFPKNLDTVQANTDFTIQLAVNNMELGHFTNANLAYYSAPQKINAQGLLVGHSHITIEALQSIDQTTPLNSQDFVFFKGLNAPPQNGVLTTTVTGGLPAGVYRMGTINSAQNHQAALVSVAQRGMLDDVVYFTITADGKAATGANPPTASAPAATASAPAAPPATGKGNNKGQTGKVPQRGQGKNRRMF